MERSAEFMPNGQTDLFRHIRLLDIGAGPQSLSFLHLVRFRITAHNDGLLAGCDFKNSPVSLQTVHTGIHDHVQNDQLYFVVFEVLRRFFTTGNQAPDGYEWTIQHILLTIWQRQKKLRQFFLRFGIRFTKA